MHSVEALNGKKNMIIFLVFDLQFTWELIAENWPINWSISNNILNIKFVYLQTLELLPN